MNEMEIQRLAIAVHALRPDWPLPSLRTFIADKLAVYAYRDATLVLIFVATDPTTRTPARVLEDGPWWQATRNATDDPTPLPPRIDRRALAEARCHRTPSEDVTEMLAGVHATLHGKAS